MYTIIIPATAAENGVGMALIDSLTKFVCRKVVETATRVKGIHIIDVLLIFQHGTVGLCFFVITD